MGTRLELQDLLEDILTTDKVYFQTPTSLEMSYPCIVYKRDDINTTFANNYPYSLRKRYMVTVIDRNPDSTISDRISELPTCLFNRAYVANNLNHDVFILYF